MKNIPEISEKIANFAAKTKKIFGEVFVPQTDNQFLPKVLKSKYLFWYGATLLVVKIALISLALILPTTSFFSAITSERLIALINQERQVRNLLPLALNASLNSVADLKVNDMLNQDYFDHTSPAGVTPWHWFEKIGYNYAFAGENLAMGFIDTDAVFQAWMNSPTHRDNILNPNYREMGLAVKSGQIQNHADTLAVLVFGKQPVVAPKTQIAQKTPALTPPVAANKTFLAPSFSASPSAAPALASSPTPINQSEQVELETILAQQPSVPAKSGQTARTNLSYAPRVLGAFASKGDEIFKSLYLYFTLFLAIALMVNVLVKIKIQYWPTIAATTLIILLSTALIFI